MESTEVEFSLTVANSFALGWELAWLFDDTDPAISAPDSGSTVVSCGGT